METHSGFFSWAVGDRCGESVVFLYFIVLVVLLLGVNTHDADRYFVVNDLVGVEVSAEEVLVTDCSVEAGSVLAEVGGFCDEVDLAPPALPGRKRGCWHLG